MKGGKAYLTYKVIKNTVSRKNLYAHFKSGDTLFIRREPTDEANDVNDYFALAEMLYSRIKEDTSNENYRTNESERNCA